LTEEDYPTLHQEQQEQSFTNSAWRRIMSDDKQKTLCAHVEEELHIKDPQAYLALIRPATHYCKGCGRSASKAENVCKPKKFP